MIMCSLLLLLSLLHIVTSTVYTVTPDDQYHPNTTCHDCHNLQYYLLNITKYFTSNTRLLFLPGLHHLHTDLIIQDAHNISLIGSTANGTTLDTVIQCNSTDSFGVLISNITNITIRDLIIQNCTMMEIYRSNYFTEISIEIFSCLNVYMQNLIIIATPELSIIATNVWKKFSLLNITSKGIKVYYTDNDNYILPLPMEQNGTFLSIDNFTLIPQYKSTDILDYYYYPYWNFFTSPPVIFISPIDPTVQNNLVFNKDKFEQTFTALTVNLLQNTYNVSIKLSNTTFHKLYDYEVISINIKNCNNNINNKIFMNRCKFKINNSSLIISLIKITAIVCGTNFTAQNSENLVIFQNCLFHGNKYTESMIKFDHTVEMISDVYGVPPKILLHIIGCIFQTSGIRVYGFIRFSGARLQNAKLFIENTNFEESFVDTAIILSDVSLVFKGPIIFSAIKATVCLLKTDTDITFYNDVEFSNIEADGLIYGTSYSNINVMGNAHIKIRNNKISSYIFSFASDRSHLYKLCYFQFYRISNNFTETTKYITTIEIAFKNVRQAFNTNAGNINCKFNPNSLYYGSNPLPVYSTHFIVHFANNSNNKSFSFDTGLLCKCQGAHKNCYTNLLDPIYPG